jgi:hypothetical protein
MPKRVGREVAGAHFLDHSIPRQPLSSAGGAHKSDWLILPNQSPGSDLWIVPIFLDLNDWIGPVPPGLNVDSSKICTILADGHKSCKIHPRIYALFSRVN